jgi:hypothetical protein
VVAVGARPAAYGVAAVAARARPPVLLAACRGMSVSSSSSSSSSGGGGSSTEHQKCSRARAHCNMNEQNNAKHHTTGFTRGTVVLASPGCRPAASTSRQASQVGHEMPLKGQVERTAPQQVYGRTALGRNAMRADQAAAVWVVNRHLLLQLLPL